jgi:hypothetical protein
MFADNIVGYVQEKYPSGASLNPQSNNHIPPA